MEKQIGTFKNVKLFYCGNSVSYRIKEGLSTDMVDIFMFTASNIVNDNSGVEIFINESQSIAIAMDKNIPTSPRGTKRLMDARRKIMRNIRTIRPKNDNALVVTSTEYIPITFINTFLGACVNNGIESLKLYAPLSNEDLDEIQQAIQRFDDVHEKYAALDSYRYGVHIEV